MSRLDRHVAVVQNKLTLGKLLTALAWSLLAFGVLVWVYLLVWKIFAVNLPRPWMFFWIGLSASVISAAGYAFLKRPTRHQAAVAIDERLGLKEKFSTALYIRPSTDPFAAAAVRDAERTADNVSLHNQFPLTFPKPAMFTVGVAVIAFATTLLPAMDLFGVEQRRKVAAEQAAVRKNVEAEVKKALAVIEAAPPAVKSTEQVKAAKQDLANMLAKPVKDTTRRQEHRHEGAAGRGVDQAEDQGHRQLRQGPGTDEAVQRAWASRRRQRPGRQGPQQHGQGRVHRGDRGHFLGGEELRQDGQKEKEKAAQQMQNMAKQLQQMANDPKQQQQMQKQLQQLGRQPAAGAADGQQACSRPPTATSRPSSSCSRWPTR